MLPILGCLNVAEMEGDARYSLGPNRTWHGASEIQDLFLRQILPHRAQTDLLSEAELCSIASDKAEELNAFLASQGFPGVQLRPFTGPYDFGMASVLKVGVTWRIAGTADTLQTRHGEFPAARLKHGVNYYRADRHAHPIASIPCANGDTVYITKMDDDIEGLDLVERGLTLLRSLTRADSEFDGLIYPMVNYDRMVDIDWLIGLWTTDQHGRRAVISQALQQTRFMMNHLGARTESAVALGVTRGMSMSKPVMVVDDNFLVIHVRPDMNLPIIAIRCCSDCWKDPGQI
jgi:hypothetical protein